MVLNSATHAFCIDRAWVGGGSGTSNVIIGAVRAVGAVRALCESAPMGMP